MAQEKPRKLDSDEVLKTISIQHEGMWSLWQREQQLVNFYNSENLPQTDAECGDEAPVSLGLGYRYVSKPLGQLLDTVLNKPGFIKTEVCYPLVAQRQFLVAQSVDTEINAIVQPRMQSIMTSLCGRAMITGRAFLFRLSRWDWMFKSGRLICPLDAPDDILDEGFREWAFTGKISLRQLDEQISGSRESEGFYGWSHAALMDLKRFIADTTFAEKKTSAQVIDNYVQQPFLSWDWPAGRYFDTLEVYWYFRKNGLRTDRGKYDGHEKIDLYCISRWGCTTSVQTSKKGEVTYKALDIANNENQRTIYYLPSAFESVKECLLPMLLDARISGDQQMAQIDGVGKIMTPRLMAMEHLTFSLMEGLAFMVQPNWQYTTAVDAETIKNFQKAGLNPWDAVPAGMSMMNKQQGMQGSGSVLQMLQMLGMSAEADAQTGEMSPLGESQAKFKVEAQIAASQLGVQLTRRKEKAMICWDELAELQTETLTRPLNLWRRGDAGYYDARRFQRQMLEAHGVLPAEYAPERMKASCRRLMGMAEKGQAAQKAALALNTFGGQMSPEATRMLAKEAIRAEFDDSFANVAFPDEVKINPDQVRAARDQNSAALVDLVIPAREGTDNPQEHMPIHVAALQNRLRIYIQQGSVTGDQQQGLAALLVHASYDLRGLPRAVQAQVGPVLQQMAAALQKLPNQAQQSELTLKQQDLQLKAGKLQLSAQHEQNLVQDRQTKAQAKQQDFMLKLSGFLEQQKNNGVTRAAQLLDMMQTDGLNDSSSSARTQPDEQPA